MTMTNDWRDGDGFLPVELDDLPLTLDIEFAEPITGSNGQTYTGIHLEEPTGNMVERAEAELTQAMSPYHLRRYQLALIGQAAGVPPDVVRKMRIRQIKEAHRFLTRYIDAGPPIGAT